PAATKSDGPAPVTSDGPAPVTPVAPAGERGLHLESALRSYAIDRLLSKRQQLILRHYLSGQSDKEIAYHCRCAEATVYEHWRRMARKAGGNHKGDVITDFHRFLGGY
ncbi:MAG TPA: LuxR C-terminal-related transcriptional regulator, partial [Polyangiaceae bacterium]|nr:LuxR C-terminal-related transcriptional regulator [Polyangiaceae bacterium]